MNQLVMHHTYIDGSTFDVSGKGNHGIPVDVVPGSGPANGSYEFSQPTSGIMVPPSPTLENLTAIRIRMKIRTEPWLPDRTLKPRSRRRNLNERRNLMEGFVSFALFLDNVGKLQATIVDTNGQWLGLTDNGAVTPNAWHEIELSHDGISRMQLKVNGQVVAARADVRGPVRSVGPLGIAIGRWPDANQYVFKGNIGELQLWRYDPIKTVTDLLNSCCGNDRSALDALMAELREKGIGWRDMIGIARDGSEVSRDLMWALRQAGETATLELDRIVAGSELALLQRDRSRLGAFQRRMRALIDSAIGREAYQQYEQQMRTIAAQIGLSSSQANAVLRALCLDFLIPPQGDDSKPDGRPSPLAEGGPWDDVRTPEPFPEQKGEPD